MFLYCRQNTFLCVVGCTEKYEEELDWILNGISEKGRFVKKVVIYVNSIAMCERLYIWLLSSLKDKAYGGARAVEHRLIEVFHAHTDQVSKTIIMSEFVKEDSLIISES